MLFYKENRSGLVHCNTAGIPPPTIQWSRRDPYLQYYLPLPGEDRIVIHSNGSLGFYPMKKEDWGIYCCEAENYLGVDVATWIIWVESKRKRKCLTILIHCCSYVDVSGEELKVTRLRLLHRKDTQM